MSENFFGRRIGLESKGRKGREFSDPGIPGTGPRYSFLSWSGYIQVADFLSSPVLVGPVWIHSWVAKWKTVLIDFEFVEPNLEHEEILLSTAAFYIFSKF